MRPTNCLPVSYAFAVDKIPPYMFQYSMAKFMYDVKILHRVSISLFSLKNDKKTTNTASEYSKQ